MEAADRLPGKKASCGYSGFSRPGRWQAVSGSGHFHGLVPETCSYFLCLPMLPLHHTLCPHHWNTSSQPLDPEGVYENTGLNEPSTNEEFRVWSPGDVGPES